MVCGVGAALYLLVAVVEGLRGESLIDRQKLFPLILSSRRRGFRFLPRKTSTSSYVQPHLRKKVGVAHLKRKNCSSLQKSHSGWAEGPGGGERI